MANIKTITLNGTEQTVKISGLNCSILNLGAAEIYASAKSGITAEADGVLTIPAGSSATLLDSRGSVSILGTGKAQLVGSDYTANPFKTSAQSGGSGADEVARAAISAHESNTAVHVSADEKAAWSAVNYINPNQIINPNFKINQRGKSGTVTVADLTDSNGYFVDRWKLVDGSVTINSGGSITLNGTIVQILETAIGTTFVASSSAGTASYDDGTKTFTLTASGELIEWAKLEIGAIATQFSPPDPATELAKCQRYLTAIRKNNRHRMQSCNSNSLGFTIPIPVSLRTGTPSIVNDSTLSVCDIGGAAITGFTFICWYTDRNGEIYIQAAKNNHGLTDGTLVSLTGDTLISAEL
jgi:hypothetical protein